MVTLTPRLERALAALPESFSSVIRLVDLGERSYRDAAEELGVPVGTVMSRLFRGRRLLAVALAEPPEREAAPALPRAA
jgi:RNA polymerase sigma-70 factor (ECF subfamily)